MFFQCFRNAVEQQKEKQHPLFDLHRLSFIQVRHVSNCRQKFFILKRKIIIIYFVVENLQMEQEDSICWRDLLTFETNICFRFNGEQVKVYLELACWSKSQWGLHPWQTLDWSDFPFNLITVCNLLYLVLVGIF